MDDDVTSHDLKRHKGSFEDEEVPASSDTESIINEASSKTDERRGDGKVSDHFGNACSEVSWVSALGLAWNVVLLVDLVAMGSVACGKSKMGSLTNGDR